MVKKELGTLLCEYPSVMRYLFEGWDKRSFLSEYTPLVIKIENLLNVTFSADEIHELLKEYFTPILIDEFVKFSFFCDRWPGDDPIAREVWRLYIKSRDVLFSTLGAYVENDIFVALFIGETWSHLDFEKEFPFTPKFSFQKEVVHYVYCSLSRMAQYDRSPDLLHELLTIKIDDADQIVARAEKVVDTLAKLTTLPCPVEKQDYMTFISACRSALTMLTA